MLRRFLSLFVAFIVLFGVSAPAFATGMEVGGGGGAGVGIPIVGNINLDLVDFADYWHRTKVGYGNTLWNLIDQDVCSHAPQFGGGHKFVPVRTMKDGQVGMYYQCEYCGRSYGDMLEEAYQDYVQENMGDFISVDSSGRFPITLYFNAMQGEMCFSRNNIFETFALSSSNNSSDIYLANFGQGSVFFSTRKTGYTFKKLVLSSTFEAPCTGSLIVSSPVAVSTLLNGGSNSKSFNSSRFGSYNLYAGEDYTLSFAVSEIIYVATSINSITFNYGLVSAYIVPSVPNSVYSADLRVASASGDGMYGYVGNDGVLYQSTVGTIYNEETNVYQNPVTGDTSNIDSWVYDYSDRSYTLTTTEGDTVTVTYGDENVTINQGGTTYNVYYLTEEPEEVLSEPVHVHNYTSTITTSPTCMGTGVRTFTCDCGESYTETVPATGHSFGAPVVTVAPTCTGTGVQTVTCSICGETAQSVIPATGHSYSSEVTLESDCVNTGVRTYVCSACGDSYTQTIPATGHRWQVVATVPTTYDTESGQLIMEGYTLYECATCHEQYRIAAESGGASLPSPAPDGTSTGNTDLVEIDSGVGRGFLATIARGVTEDLPEVLQLVSQWFTVIPSLHEGFNKFLQQELSFFPPEVLLLFSFSIGVTVVVGFCRFLFRR